MNEERDWHRLARFARAARGSRSQKSVDALGGPSHTTLGKIERAEWRPTRAVDDTVEKLERAYNWQPGSVDAILAGGDPTPLGGPPEDSTVQINTGHLPKHGVEALEDTWADRDHRISPSKLQQLQAESVAFIGTRAGVAGQLIVVAGNLADSLGHLDRGDTGAAWAVLMNSSERLVRLAAALTAQAYMADPYGDTNEGPTISEFRKKLDEVTALLRRLEELAVARSRATDTASNEARSGARETKEDGNAVEDDAPAGTPGEAEQDEEVSAAAAAPVREGYDAVAAVERDLVDGVKDRAGFGSVPGGDGGGGEGDVEGGHESVG